MRPPLSPKGFSLVELLVTIAILSFLSLLIIVLINPEEAKRRARDAQRLSDLSSLSRAIETFYIDKNHVLPDLNAKNVTRRSNELPSGNTTLANGRGLGWLDEDLSGFLENLPLDPLNTQNFIYRYRVDCAGLRYRLDARLEFYTELMLNTKDGGQDSNYYEVGTDNSTNPINMEAGGC